MKTYEEKFQHKNYNMKNTTKKKITYKVIT